MCYLSQLKTKIIFYYKIHNNYAIRHALSMTCAYRQWPMYTHTSEYNTLTLLGRIKKLPIQESLEKTCDDNTYINTI